MFDEDRVLELAQAEDEAHFRDDLVLSLPKGSYTTEEMWDIRMDIFRVSIAIQDEMRRHFEQKCKESPFCRFIHIFVYNIDMTKTGNIESLIELASSQWGLFTSAQALRVGVSRTQLSRMSADGRVEATSYATYRFTAGEETADTRLAAT